MKNIRDRLMIPILRRFFGYEVWNYKDEFPPDFDEPIAETIRKVARFTSTSRERLFGLCKAVEYIVSNKIPGAIVECGVWRGGSMMAVADTLLRLGHCDRDLYLFDTYTGMPLPGDEDVDYWGLPAGVTWKKLARKNHTEWCYAPLAEVERNLLGTGYDRDKTHFVKGMVEDTVPDLAPAAISLLRLDTDWYTSVRHELEYLFPRVSVGGVIIIDDYGHWKGARQATDEYIRDNKIGLLLNRLDYTARIGVKS